MLTYSFDSTDHSTLYEHLYNCIKNDILSGAIAPGDRLPSKRSLAKNLSVSTITVENAYGMLVDEGYIYSLPKKGYYASDIVKNSLTLSGRTDAAHIKTGSSFGEGSCEIPHNLSSQPSDISGVSSSSQSGDIGRHYLADFVSNRTNPDNFPFSTWVRLLRETIHDRRSELMISPPSGGIYELRQAICDYLYQFRGMKVHPDQVIIGAGTEYLYSLLIQLLGRDKQFAVENPGYPKISMIYEKNGVSCRHIPLDSSGVNISALADSEADILHISPSHHFPTGITTPVSRRFEILRWASESDSRYIIEDDYDSEFRLSGRPLPTLQSIDKIEKVIYINTFTKSLASTVRISYMILPPHLMRRFHKELGFYSCTVSNFEQYTLARFLSEGYFEKHINRMRKYYRNQRNAILDQIRKAPGTSNITITEENSGLHFLIHFPSELSDSEIIHRAQQSGIRISALSEYFYRTDGQIPADGTDSGQIAADIRIADDRHSSPPETDLRLHTLVINYSGLRPETIPEAVSLLAGIISSCS